MIGLTRSTPRRRRIASRILAASALIAVVVGTGNQLAEASDIGGIFQLDGNPQDAAVATAPDDWQTLQTSTAKDVQFVASTAIPVADAQSPTDVTYFTGGGSKDVREVGAWQYSDGDVAPDKDEILNATAAAYKVDTDADNNKELVVFFSADRFANDGDSQIGFWFFKDDVHPNGSGGFTGAHMAGDILVLSDFSQGGTVANLNAYEWIGGKNPLKLLNAGAGSVDCDAAAHNPLVCAIENDGATSSIWSYTAKTGPVNSYPTGSFLEGGINVTKLVPGSSLCFASFMAETRSSTSSTAQLKDFAQGSFPVCAPKTELTMSASPAGDHHTGDPVTFSYFEKNTGTGPLTGPSVTDTNCSPVTEKKTAGFNDGDANQNSKLDPGETWVFTCSGTADSTEHVAIAHGTDANFNNVDVTWCANPAAPPTGVFCSQTERTTLTLTLINPSTTLTMSASATIVHSGDSVTFTYKELNDGDGPITGSPYAISVTDDKCSPVTAKTTTFNGNPYNVGDLDHDNVLDNAVGQAAAEEWQFTCTKNVTATETHTAVGSGTDSAGAQVTFVASGTCTSSATKFCDQSEKTTLAVTVINPGTQVTISASATVTYTFFEENKGNVPLTSISVDTSLVGCTSPATPDLVTFNGNQYNSGDLDHDNKLDPVAGATPAEKWKFSCTGPALTWKTGDPNAVQSNTGTGHGFDTSNVVSGGADVTYGTNCVSTSSKVCDSREQSSVKVTISAN
jgi:hypothetical protein